MKSSYLKYFIWISTVLYRNSAFIVIDDELESLFDVSTYNFSGKVENSSTIIANQTDDDISQLFELYDKVFNISESTDTDLTTTTNNEENIPIEVTGTTQELTFNTSDALNTNEYQSNTTVIIENEKETKADALLIESVEKIGDAEVQKEFIKEVETVQQSFGDDVPDDEDSKKNVSVSPIDDLTGYVIEENEEAEPFINYNALYEEKLIHNTTEQNLFPNVTVIDDNNQNGTAEEEFKMRRIEQVLEARISSIIFGEDFADDDNTLNKNETNIGDDVESTDEIMIAMETNLDIEAWNGTMVQNLTNMNTNETTEEDKVEDFTEPFAFETNESSTTELDLSTTETSDFTTESLDENVEQTDRTESLSDYDATEEKHDLSSVDSNISTENLNHDTPISPKTARGLTDFGVKNALSQEKHQFTNLLIDHTNTLNLTSICMITLSVVTLCLLCSVFLLLIIQKLKLLRHSDTVAPA